MKNFVSFLLLLVISASCANAQKSKSFDDSKLEDGLYALFETVKGDILIKLEDKKTPMTVANFVGLAEGKATILGKTFTAPFYNGLKFHRVIKDFMIQGGDPQGTGAGDPGYKFYDEIDPTLRHSRAGILSMANSGPATNGSQFFITHKETPWLDGKHTVFGHVVSGQAIVDKIEQNDVMNSVSIIRKGKEYKSYDASKVFQMAYDKIHAVEAEKRAKLEKIASMTQEEYKSYLLTEILKTYPKAKQTESGLIYILENEGTGDKVKAGNLLSVHYVGRFLDGTKFDSSRDRNQPMDFKFKEQGMIPGFEEGLEMLAKGGKGRFIIPYYAAYGPQGRPGAIPPYADLVFELEVVDVR